MQKDTPIPQSNPTVRFELSEPYRPVKYGKRGPLHRKGEPILHKYERAILTIDALLFGRKVKLENAYDASRWIAFDRPGPGHDWSVSVERREDPSDSVKSFAAYASRLGVMQPLREFLAEHGLLEAVREAQSKK